MPLFTKTQVSLHKSRNDLWIIVHGKVYDVSSFLSEHPGGEEVLLEHAGTNTFLSLIIVGTDASVAFEDVGHSAGAREMLKEYFIGEVTEDESKTAVKPAATKPQYFYCCIL